MDCKTYELKIDKSHLSKETTDVLRLIFVEARWFYNAIVSKLRLENAGSFDYKTTEILVKNADGNLETRRIAHLSSQVRQEIIDRTKDSLRSLAQLRKNGRPAGFLKFKSRVRSIPFKQYGMTHRISGDRIVIQSIRQPMRVAGLDQLPKGAEFASATLEEKNGDYYLHLTTYRWLTKLVCPKKAIGIDAGIKH